MILSDKIMMVVLVRRSKFCADRVGRFLTILPKPLQVDVGLNNARIAGDTFVVARQHQQQYLVFSSDFNIIIFSVRLQGINKSRKKEKEKGFTFSSKSEVKEFIYKQRFFFKKPNKHC